MVAIAARDGPMLILFTSRPRLLCEDALLSHPAVVQRVMLNQQIQCGRGCVPHCSQHFSPARLSEQFYVLFEYQLQGFSSLEECITEGISLRAGATPGVTVGTEQVCGGSRAAQTGVAPALEFGFGVCASRTRFLCSHRPTYFFHALNPGGGRTVHRIVATAATIRDIPHLFHVDIVLLSSPNRLPISRYAQVRVTGHDIALKRSRSNRIMASSGLGPAKMKHRAYIPQV